MRIALVAVLSFAALWFVALRPKPVEDAPPPAPAPAAAPGKDARATKAATAKAAPRRPRPAPAPARTEEAKAPAPSRAEAVLADIKDHRVVVLLFWDGSSGEDRSVRRTIDRIDTHGGRVRVHVANVNDLDGYEPITQGVPLVESPSVLVVDRKGSATSIGGLTVAAEIDAAVARALKVSRT